MEGDFKGYDIDIGVVYTKLECDFSREAEVGVANFNLNLKKIVRKVVRVVKKVVEIVKKVAKVVRRIVPEVVEHFCR